MTKRPQECTHCHKDINIRNPSGFCDHLYYPEGCKICQSNLDLKNEQDKVYQAVSERNQAIQERDKLENADLAAPWRNQLARYRKALEQIVEVYDEGGAAEARMIAEKALTIGGYK